MNKIFNKFLIGSLFLLGIILIPTYKVDAVITVTVFVDDVAANKTVLRDSNVQISWESTGATSCSEAGGRGGTGTKGFFPVNNIQATETFTVNCSAPDAPTGYCSGTYTNINEKVDWNGSPFNWTSMEFYGNHCGYCSDIDKAGYRTDSASWYRYACVKTGWLWCNGSHWSEGYSYVRSAYSVASCGGYDNVLDCVLSKYYIDQEAVPGVWSTCAWMTESGEVGGTCTDGIQNGDETGIDTGGRCGNCTDESGNPVICILE